MRRLVALTMILALVVVGCGRNSPRSEEAREQQIPALSVYDWPQGQGAWGSEWPSQEDLPRIELRSREETEAALRRIFLDPGGIRRRELAAIAYARGYEYYDSFRRDVDSVFKKLPDPWTESLAEATATHAAWSRGSNPRSGGETVRKYMFVLEVDESYCPSLDVLVIETRKGLWYVAGLFSSAGDKKTVRWFDSQKERGEGTVSDGNTQ